MSLTTSIPLGQMKGGPSSLAAFNLILKEFYEPATRDLLNRKRILSRMIRENTADVDASGKYAVVSLNVGGNEGTGSVAEGALLPDPGKQDYKVAKYDTRYSYMTVMFTGPSVNASRNDRGSFLRIMDAEMRGAARDVQHENNRVLFGDGTGRLATVAADLGGGQYQMKDAGGIVSTGLGTQYLRKKMRICAFDDDSDDIGAATFRVTAGGERGAIITDVDYSAGTITLDNAIVDLQEDDYIFRVSEISSTVLQNATSRGNDPFGIAAIVDDGNPGYVDGAHGYAAGVGEVDASAEPAWQAAVLDNGGIAVPFAPDMLQQSADFVDQHSDGAVGVYLTTHGIRRQYVNNEIAAKRYPGTMSYDGGFKAISHNGRPMIVDKDCQRGRIYGLDLETISRYMAEDYHWLMDGASYLSRLPGFDVYYATMARYWQVGTWARNRNVLITNIQDT